MNPSRLMAVMAFEWRRSIASRRFISWIFLIGFPVLIMVLTDRIGASSQVGITHTAWALTIFAFVPGICCMLSLLLTAAGFLQAEIEGRTWIYMAIRPGVKTDMLYGKYLYAVSRTVITASIALLLCLLVSGQIGHVRLVVVMWLLIVLSSLAYAAVYVLIGVIAVQRALVVAVAYSAIEFGVSFIPAVVTQVTIQYRLRSLLIQGMQWDSKESSALSGFMADANMFSTQPWWLHVGIMLGLIAGTLMVTTAILKRRELGSLKAD